MYNGNSCDTISNFISLRQTNQSLEENPERTEGKSTKNSYFNLNQNQIYEKQFIPGENSSQKCSSSFQESKARSGMEPRTRHQRSRGHHGEMPSVDHERSPRSALWHQGLASLAQGSGYLLAMNADLVLIMFWRSF